MSDDLSPVLSLPLIQPAQAQKHVTHNEALRLLDVLVQPAVSSRSTPTPPPFPAQGARWIVPTAATGAWAGQDGAIALFDLGDWMFLAPLPGWQVQVVDEGASVHWTGSAWVAPADLPQRFPRLGVGTEADAVNRLAVASEATLFSHSGAGHQLKLNKAGPGDTASLLFQTGWSGRAEMGTAGSDDFAIKVSADGSAWTTALSIAGASGLVGGSAVTQSASDATAGRLLKVGDFGLGGAAPVIGNAAVTDGSIAQGFWTYRTASGSSGGPDAVNSGVLVHSRRSGAGGGGETQMLITESGTGTLNGAIFSRSRISGDWMPWRRSLRDLDILGTVAQTGGQPGGALFQQASSANGRFERRASGWQICLRSDLSAANVATAEGGVFRSANITWTFPAAFLAGSKPVVQITAEHQAILGFGIVALSDTAVTFRVKAATSISGAVSVQASAIGSWSDMV